MDLSLGSLPTLIVPDDPETGAIERPETPPPIQVDEQQLAATSAPPPKPAGEAAASPRQPSVASAKSPRTPAPVSIKSPRTSAHVSVKSPRASNHDAPGVAQVPGSTSAGGGPNPASSDAAASPASIPEVGETPMVPPAPPSPVQKAASVSSKDFVTMSRRAAALAKLDRLAGGNKSVFDASMSDIGALGIGMQLYFMLTKGLGLVFLSMGVISLPVIVVNYFGDGVTSKMADPLQLAYASLGNQGVSDEVKQDSSLCLPQGEVDCTWATVRTPFTTDPVTVSWIVTASDAIYSFVFLLFVLVFRARARRAIELHQAENLTPAKYAVFVRGLPPDATKREILEHFSSRFDPTLEEQYFPLFLGCCWGRRRKVKHSLSRGAANRSVVSNVEHLSGVHGADIADADLYIGSWVAEVSVAHPTGGLLRTFLSMEALTRSIAEAEQLIAILEQEKREAEVDKAALAAALASADAATAKKLRRQKPKAVFRPGDEKLLQAAAKKLALLNAQMEKKTGKIKAFKQHQRDGDKQKRTASSSKGGASAPSASATVAPAPSPPTAALHRQPTMKETAASVKKAATATVKAFDLEACECAFVVFNNLESRRRCLRDYRRSTRWLPRKYQPRLLRFRDGAFPLTVVPAPEPSNILWENLEVTDRGRLYRRSFTNLVTFLLLLFSCIIISAAQSAQQQFKAKMPPAGLCDYSLPAVYYGSLSFADAKTRATRDLVWDLEWDRNETCAPGTNNEARYYISYPKGELNPLHVAHAPIVKPGESAPERCTDPCVSDASSATCSTLPCFDQDLLNAGDVCETYLASHALYCLCTAQLQTSISALGVVDGPQALWADFEPCRGFIKDYLTKNAFIVLASGVVVIVNMLLKAILRAFASFERHSSESAKASAIALKMFMAQFLNTAVIVLIVNASLNLNKVPLVNDLFKGKYHDFEREWYPTVGMAITMTMLINAFVPHIVLALQMFILAPVTRFFKRRSVRTQQQMDKLYAGPAFDMSVRYPMVLNSVFVTMIFSGGSPVLLFIAALTCGGTFWFDKLSILRMYSVKTAYDEELGETALHLLPWTLVLHLGFSAWMYGNPNLMKSPTLNLGVVFDAVGLSVASGAESSEAVYAQLLAKASQVDILGQYGFVVKIVRANVMVMFLFCAVTLVGLLLSAVWLQVLRPVLAKTVGVLLLAIWRRCRCCCCRRRKRIKPASDSRSSGSRRSAKVAVDNTPASPPVVPEQPASPVTAAGPPSASTIDPVAGVDQSVSSPSTPDVVSPVTGEEPPAPDASGVAMPLAQGEVVEVTVPKSARVSVATPETPPTSTTPAQATATTTPAPATAAPAPDGASTPPSLSARLTARLRGKKREVVLPEFTDVFRKSVPRHFRPDTQLGFSVEPETGELVRRWREETISNGRARMPGDRMRTWEALQAPVKIYAIEANVKYRLAFSELVAASKRSRSASASLAKVKAPGDESPAKDAGESAAAWTDLTAVPTPKAAGPETTEVAEQPNVLEAAEPAPAEQEKAAD